LFLAKTQPGSFRRKVGEASYGYIPTIEFYPWDDVPLKFFAGYIGRVYEYSDYTKIKIDVKDYDTGRVMVGLISPLKVL